MQKIKCSVVINSLYDYKNYVSNTVDLFQHAYQFSNTTFTWNVSRELQILWTTVTKILQKRVTPN